MSCPIRTYPLRKPEGHVPPIPRWQLVLPEHVQQVFTAYVGVQRLATDPPALAAAARASSELREWLAPAADAPVAAEEFSVLDGHDVAGCGVWVCYWTDVDSARRKLAQLRLADVHARLGDASPSVGLWCEQFSTAIARLETNYSGLDYLPGLARVPGSTTAAHEVSAYWGAARDRIPDSAHDQFERAKNTAPPLTTPAGLRERLVGSNYEHMVHIRSGQFWENCGPQESDAYRSKLKPTLEAGLAYLWQNAVDTGTIGLRYLCNLGPEGRQRQETCGAGFFRSLGDLEHWAESHPSHLAIFHGAIDHATAFGAGRKLRTWHEVSVLKQGEAAFEYVNCHPATGVIRFVKLERSTL